MKNKKNENNSTMIMSKMNDNGCPMDYIGHLIISRQYPTGLHSLFLLSTLLSSSNKFLHLSTRVKLVIQKQN